MFSLQSIAYIYSFFLLLLLTTTTASMSSAAGVTSKSVLGKPLAYFGGSPIKTGFFRDGYCRTSAADHGAHSVAGIVSEQFLDFSASRGNDLRVVGLKEGCRWCLCVSRWREAFDAHKEGLIGKDAVPKVMLAATEDTALKKVDLKELQQFAADGHDDL